MTGFSSRKEPQPLKHTKKQHASSPQLVWSEGSVFSCSPSRSADSLRSNRHAQSQHAFLIKMRNLVSLSPPCNSHPKSFQCHLSAPKSVLSLPRPARSPSQVRLFQQRFCTRLAGAVQCCSLCKHSCFSDLSPESPLTHSLYLALSPSLSLMCCNWTSLADNILWPLTSVLWRLMKSNVLAQVCQWITSSAPSIHVNLLL